MNVGGIECRRTSDHVVNKWMKGVGRIDGTEPKLSS